MRPQLHHHLSPGLRPPAAPIQGAGGPRTVRKSEQLRQTYVPGLCFGGHVLKGAAPLTPPLQERPHVLTPDTVYTRVTSDKGRGRRDTTQQDRSVSEPDRLEDAMNLIFPNLVTEGSTAPAHSTTSQRSPPNDYIQCLNSITLLQPFSRVETLEKPSDAHGGRR